MEGSHHTNNYGMLKNYLIVGWRNLLKKKAYSAINIFGLGLGIACCLLIFMYVEYERSFDNYHTKGDRIYRVIHGNKNQSTDEYWVWNNAPIGPALASNFPEIDKVVQFSGRSDILLTYGEKIFQEEGIFFMDSTVFDVFSWKLLKGNPKTALAAPYSIVLTETAAKKYFGDEEPLGKSIKGTDSPGRANAGDYLVTGVMEDVPANSHFKFDMLLSLSTFRKSIPDIFTNWGYVDFYTYFLVNDKFDRARFEQKLPGFIERQMKDPNNRYAIQIEPLKDAYLRTPAQRQPGETGSLANLYIFSIIGLFILAIAMINFMNLSTARSMERSKEVGVRKSIGANRKSLITQFLSESLIIVYLSMMVAIVIVTLAMPGMISITGRALDIQQFITPQNIGILAGISLVIALVAGSYPSFVLSAFNPVMVLKGMSKSGKSGVALRRGLVVLQFSLSIALIAGTMIVYSQMNHILNKDMGFDKERMLILDYNYDFQVNRQREAFKTEMEANSEILSTAFTRSVPGGYYPNAGTEIQTPEGKMNGNGQPIFQVGMDFVNHFNLKLVAGRSYSRDHPADTIGNLVINESMAKQYGYTNPADIIGKKYSQWGREGEVIGVVKDFNFTSLHRPIQPLSMPLEPFACRYLCLKVKSDNMTATIEKVHAIWNRMAPHRPFLYSFLDDDFAKQYQKDYNFRQLFTVFSCLAIFIACLGLLGLATHTAELKTKEIGIRKVLGADITSIVSMLSKDFVILIVVSMLIATPVAWYVMNKWLENFAYHINIQFWTFILAGLAALIVAVITISFQAIKAAVANPVKALRSE
ncbi:MAG TPA: ABC transporter permease [Cyclobacteriaceae bacterium]|nr:ABC transporter permease [Cyclobacteriaceae bacterium]